MRYFVVKQNCHFPCSQPKLFLQDGTLNGNEKNNADYEFNDLFLFNHTGIANYGLLVQICANTYLFGNKIVRFVFLNYWLVA